MTRLIERIARTGRGVESGWDDDDVDRVWRGLVRKRRRRLVRIATLGIVAGTASLATVVVMKQRHDQGTSISVTESERTGPSEATGPAQGANAGKTGKTGSPAVLPATPPAVRTLRFADGSEAIPFGADGSVTVVEDSANHVAVNLARGGARFDVVHRTDRAFSVRAGEVTITVLGTAFSVERVADRVGVAVTRGAVSVDWRSGTRQLRAGEEGWFPPLVVAPPPVDERRARATVGMRSKHAGPESRALSLSAVPPGAAAAVTGSHLAYQLAVEARPATASAASPSVPPSAQAVAGGAPHAAVAAAEPPAAPAEPSPSSPRPTRDDRGDGDAQALLTAADNARLAGHAQEGATLLRRLMRDHPADPRAPLAAFSLGRLLLGDLERPLEAARAFARARALEPNGPLAEDALAREAEAWSRAGEGARARARAEEYLRLYPRGRRAQDVRSFGGP